MKISRLFKNFYFNSQRIKFSSLFIDSTIIRRVEYCLKMILAFIISGLIAYGSSLRHYLDQQYILCVISVLSVQETVGSTLYSCIQTTISLVPLSILLFLIQLIGLSYHHYLAAEILLLTLSFIIAYQCTQIQTRKMTLLINALFFATVVNQNSLPTIFVFLLLALFLIGMIISICVSILFFPLFATFDIEHRFSYCLKNLQGMYYFIIQAFLSDDRMSAKVSLSRASILEQMIRQTMILMQPRVTEAKYEPSRLLQKIFYRKRKHIIDLNIQEQANLINSLMFHICSLQIMVNQCQFNEYHTNLRNNLESSIYYLNSCQSSLISSFISSRSITNNELMYRLLNLTKAVKSVRLSYKNIRFISTNSLESTQINQSENHLSHAFFLFQLFYIVRILTEITTDRKYENNIENQQRNFSLKQYFIFERSRFLSAFKCMIIIGVGSMFVMIPYLAKIFENGQWVLIALCMTQSDTVGGAFTTMKMRLTGTLLGAMWSYITYLLVHDNIFQTFLVLIPWIFLFGYLRLYPKWAYTAAVAAITPVLINLGRLPYGDKLPAGNYALLRIEENLVGILIAIILTMTIFPVFAIDLLKENIQKSLQSCRESVDSMHKVYDELFHHQHLEKDISIYFNNKNQIKPFLDKQRSYFHQLISSQRILVSNASIEPTFCWFKNGFSSSRYNLIVQQQIDIFRMLHNIDATLICLSECSIHNEHELEFLKIQAADGLFLPNLHNELFDLSKQLNDCLQIWSYYFKLSQTRCYYITRGLIPHRIEFIQSDLLKQEQCLIDLNKTIHRLENKHQQGINRLFDQYFQQFNHDENSTIIVSYLQNQQADFILLSLSAMYYSITQLAYAALALGTTIHEVFELETTDLYQAF
ncbi:unnamed protein product [Adineta steineri]|uniref:Integral membrane bound transporter domain-containing protein n=1 Tax=Adineta steineri TaxID=433720 RepID=A0A815G359_9BILA|nr:unnamed protein product [Adineta steineri]CAF1590282.1 unnamed protein product [Adineta steineri]